MQAALYVLIAKAPATPGYVFSMNWINSGTEDMFYYLIHALQGAVYQRACQNIAGSQRQLGTFTLHKYAFRFSEHDCPCTASRSVAYRFRSMENTAEITRYSDWRKIGTISPPEWRLIWDERADNSLGAAVPSSDSETNAGCWIAQIVSKNRSAHDTFSTGCPGQMGAFE